MSTRYLWRKSNIAYDQEVSRENKLEKLFYADIGDVYVCFSTGVTRASDGTYTMTGSIKEYKRTQGPRYLIFEDATAYKYAAPNRSGNKFYVEDSDGNSPSLWGVTTDGLSLEIFLRANRDYANPQYYFNVYNLVAIKGGDIGLVSSASSDSYPQDGKKEGFWYTYKGSDSIDPLSVTYSTDRPERGKPVTVSVTPAAISAESSQWNAASLPASESWTGIAYGGGWFVSVGGDNPAHIARSSDGGKTWSSAPNSLSRADSIAYGNGKFVLVGLDTAAYSADNGATWAEASVVPSGQWKTVCHGGGKFVAVDSYESKVMYSSDGNVWAEASIPGGNGWLGVAYGNGRFVVTAFGKIAYSENLTEWTVSQVNYGLDMWRSIAFADGKFVMVGGGKSAYSANAESWTISTVLSSFDFECVAYGNGKFVAVGSAIAGSTASSTTICAFSADASLWETLTMPTSENWAAIAYGSDCFAAVSMGSTGAAYLPDEVDLGYTVSYLYQYSANGGSSWTAAGGATADTQNSITVPDNAEQFMVRVRAQDDIGFTSADYVTGANLEVQIMRLWVGVNNVARKGTKLWVGVDGAARRVVRAWVGVDGVARRWF